MLTHAPNNPSLSPTEFLQSVQGLDPVTYLPRLAGRSLRMQQVMSDPVTPPAAKDKIASAVPVSEVDRYPDLTTASKELGPNGIVGWLGQQIQYPQGSTHAQLDQAKEADSPQ